MSSLKVAPALPYEYFETRGITYFSGTFMKPTIDLFVQNINTYLRNIHYRTFDFLIMKYQHAYNATYKPLKCFRNAAVMTPTLHNTVCHQRLGDDHEVSPFYSWLIRLIEARSIWLAIKRHFPASCSVHTRGVYCYFARSKHQLL